MKRIYNIFLPQFDNADILGKANKMHMHALWISHMKKVNEKCIK